MTTKNTEITPRNATRDIVPGVAFDAVEARDNSTRVIDCALTNMKYQQECETTGENH